MGRATARLIVGIALALGLGGCALPWTAPGGTTGEAPAPPSTTGRPPHEKVPNTIRYEPPPEAPKNRAEAEKIADRLVELALADPYVRRATAVVLGPYAVVAIGVDEHLSHAQVTTTKYAVAEALKHDPYGARAIVTADPDLFARLQAMRDKIARGEPLVAVFDELADIVGRLAPELPRGPKIREPADGAAPIAPVRTTPGGTVPSRPAPGEAPAAPGTPALPTSPDSPAPSPAAPPPASVP
ncbi:MAG: YhcN/YlaJ family sporulation lipoprotein [Hydrogenibacillus schlegelii]|nr:YhcN/YlaJ family sporulation lipoprotein [Hydrogenibacillus schlegelii]